MSYNTNIITPRHYHVSLIHSFNILLFFSFLLAFCLAFHEKNFLFPINHISRLHNSVVFLLTSWNGNKFENYYNLYTLDVQFQVYFLFC